MQAEGRSRKEAGQQDWGRLTTGLARAELALEEARELELRWPLYSEGWPPPRDTQIERKEQGQQRSQENGGCWKHTC